MNPLQKLLQCLSTKKDPSAADKAPLSLGVLALRWVVFCLFSLFSGLFFTLLGLIISYQSLSSWFDLLTYQGVWISALFLGLLVLTLNLLSCRLWVGAVVVGMLSCGITLVNYYKLAMTVTPLSLGDFSLLTSLGSIVSLNSSAIAISWKTIFAGLLLLFWLVLMLLLSPRLSLRWRWSVLGGLLSGLSFYLLFWVFVNPLFWIPLQVEQELVMEQLTVNSYCSSTVLGLWRSLNCKITLGNDYVSMDDALTDIYIYLSNQQDDSRDTADSTREQDSVRPNIILLLSESFFDVTTLQGVDFDQDPISAFHALQEEGVSGTFYTRSLGYGTCNVELEVLTGLNTGLMTGDDLYSYDASVFDNLPSLPSLFSDCGYDTGFIHTYDDSIYGRNEIYQYMGIQHIYFSGDFIRFFQPLIEVGGSAYWDWMYQHVSGRYFSDALLTDLIIANYEYTRSDSDAPVFIFAASMENHQPYNEKYTQEELSVSLSSSLLDEEATDILTNFVQGCHNASEALATLVDYYRDCEEPTIIIFFGDHRPGLGLTDTGTVYTQLGLVSQDRLEWSLEDYAQLYSTSFLIWANDESLLPQAAGSTLDTSCNYLGSLILEMADIELPSYWQLISLLSESRLIDTASYHLGTDGSLSATLPGEGEAATQLQLLSQTISAALNSK